MTAYRYVLYLSRAGDDDTQTACAMFHQIYNARKFLDVLLADDLWEWSDGAADSAHGYAARGTTILSSTGVVVSTLFYPRDMLEVVEHDLTLAEIARSLGEGHRRRALWFRAGPNLPRTLAEDRSHVERQERRARSAPRSSRAGLVPVADVALSLGMSPRDVRATLRRLEIPKPPAGWAWSASDAEAIKAQIRGAR